MLFLYINIIGQLCSLIVILFEAHLQIFAKKKIISQKIIDVVLHI